ncbi:TauD/TfdA dioxygenase family protein [Streptomyces sp. NPDC059866]|uniref:TauD/TfdA dioxygenase family protein n=1 Tax=Streptomyces sp. NPDC059866 TaxID=3346978 RepID=UPI0036661A15
MTALQGTTLGAEVRGPDLRELDDADWAGIEAAFHEHGILVFHDQSLGRDEQVAFARRFGEIELQDADTMRADLVGKPIVLDISNVDENSVHIKDRDHPQTRFLGGNEGWHSDSSFKAVSAKASVLHAIEVPSTGGRTGYADMRAAYDELSDADKAALEGLTVFHSLQYSQAAAGATDTEAAAVPSDMNGAWHPLVKRHPVTGRRSLFIGRHACQVEGMPVAEGQALLGRLLDAACVPPRTYYHPWRPGDVVVWDNRCVLHRATAWDLAERRVLRHVRVAGEG